MTFKEKKIEELITIGQDFAEHSTTQEEADKLAEEFIDQAIESRDKEILEWAEKGINTVAIDKLDEVDERAKMTNLLNENLVIGYQQANIDIKSYLTKK